MTAPLGARHAELAAQLRPLGRLDVAEAQLAPLAIDSRRPALALSPDSPDAVAAAVGIAAEHGAAVAPFGSGTKVDLGNPPQRYDLALRLHTLDRILEYEPADLTVTVQAGVRLSAVQRRLAADGQFLALDPPHAEAATIGGILATNASGPSRLLYGSARDLVLGMRFATADGELAKTGGKVVKNVVGYDLNKMHIGALGTLGVLVEVTFKVAPLPRQERTLWARFAGLAEAHGFSGRLSRSQLAPRAVELLDAAAARQCGLPGDAPWLVLFHAAGSPATVARQVSDAAQWAQADGATGCGQLDGDAHADLWTAVRALPGTSVPDGVRLKIATLPTEIVAVWEVLERAARSAGASLTRLAHAGSGITYGLFGAQNSLGLDLAAAATIVTASQSVVLPSGGSVVVESCPVALKRHLDVWGPTRDDFPIMQALKAQFDPQSLFNPGRFLGRL